VSTWTSPSTVATARFDGFCVLLNLNRGPGRLEALGKHQQGDET